MLRAVSVSTRSFPVISFLIQSYRMSSSESADISMTQGSSNVLLQTTPQKSSLSLLKDDNLCNSLHMHNLSCVTIWCFIGWNNWDTNAQYFLLCTVFLFSLKHNALLWRRRVCQCGLLRYILNASMQPFTEAYSRIQWSLQCIKSVFVFSGHWIQYIYKTKQNCMQCHLQYLSLDFI